MFNRQAPRWAHTLPSAIALMAPFDLLASLAMDIYLPVVPLMPGALGTSPARVQLTLSIYLLVLGVGQLLFGPLSDRIGRRPVLLLGRCCSPLPRSRWRCPAIAGSSWPGAQCRRLARRQRW